MISKESVGVEVSDTRLTLVYAKATPFRTEICAYAVYDLSATRERNERTATIAGMVKEFWRQNRIGDACIWIGVPAEMVIQRVIILPLAAKENLGKALEYELQKYIPLELEEMYFRYQILKEDRAERQLRLLVAAVKKKDVTPLIELRSHLDTGIYGAESAATAGINGLNWAAQSILEKSYGLAYAADRTLHLSYFQGGQPQFIWALDLNGNVEYQFEQILQELSSLGARSSGPDSSAALKVYCLGPDATEDTFQTLNRLPNFEFRPLDLSESVLEDDDPIVGAGLALKGLQQVPLDINLFPEQFRKKPSVIGRYMMLALGALALITGMAWAGSHFMQPRVVHMRVDRELDALSDEIKALGQVQAEITNLQERIDDLNNLREERMDALELLKELTEILPDSAWLLGLSVADNKVEVQGTAGYSTELIPQLEASPLFANARFLSTITKSRDGKEVFKIGLEMTRP